MVLSEQLIILKNEIANIEDHLSKLQGGRKASSAKARASLMKLKKHSHLMRSDIMKYTKELPTKTRAKTPKSETSIPEAELPVIEPVREEAPLSIEKVKKPRKPRVKKVQMVAPTFA
jgi:hypothetical protein